MRRHDDDFATSAFAMEPDEFRRLAAEVAGLTAAHLEGLGKKPVFEPMRPQEREALLSRRLPDGGLPAGEILDAIRREILEHPMGNGHPRFFGWVNSPPAPIAILAEILAAAMNPSCAGGDHAAVYLERCAVRWLMDLVGFPIDGSMGLLVSGGSAASLTCLAAARQRAAQSRGWDLRKEGLCGKPQLTMYVSEQGHSCLRKAAELMGLGEEGTRVVPVDREHRMRTADLRRQVEADRAGGAVPFCVAASAGTVNTGAVDPLDEIADFCRAEGLWLHVDGAYGAFGILDPEAAERFRGLERCDSLALDPHKWLSIPLECGCALVRDGKLLRDTFSLVPEYLRTEEGKGFGGLPWYSEYGFQQSRGFRALKLWAVLLHAGKEGVRGQICRHNRLARSLAAKIRREPQLELLADPVLSVVNFRYAPPELRGRPEDLDALNQAIPERIQSEGKVFVTGTKLRGASWLRACILHYATGEGDLDELVEAVKRQAVALAPGTGGPDPG